jgi:hypothetical protein
MKGFEDMDVDQSGSSERMSSADLAALIVDALFHGGLLTKEQLELAREIATEEIDVRKALGDY